MKRGQSIKRFAEGFYNDTQVVATILSVDEHLNHRVRDAHVIGPQNAMAGVDNALVKIVCVPAVRLAIDHETHTVGRGIQWPNAGRWRTCCRLPERGNRHARVPGYVSLVGSRL